MSGPQRKPLVVLHFCCDPTLVTDREIPSNLGCRVINSHNGFEAIQLATAGVIDAVVLELDRNHAELSLVAQEIKRARSSIPTVVVAHASQTLDGLLDLADAVVPADISRGILVKSLEQALLGGTGGSTLRSQIQRP